MKQHSYLELLALEKIFAKAWKSADKLEADTIVHFDAEWDGKKEGDKYMKALNTHPPLVVIRSEKNRADRILTYLEQEKDDWEEEYIKQGEEKYPGT